MAKQYGAALPQAQRGTAHISGANAEGNTDIMSVDQAQEDRVDNAQIIRILSRNPTAYHDKRKEMTRQQESKFTDSQATRAICPPDAELKTAETATYSESGTNDTALSPQPSDNLRDRTSTDGPEEQKDLTDTVNDNKMIDEALNIDLTKREYKEPHLPRCDSCGFEEPVGGGEPQLEQHAQHNIKCPIIQNEIDAQFIDIQSRKLEICGENMEHLRLKEWLLCKACSLFHSAVLLMPCGHFCLCQFCAKTKTCCPSCNCDIVHRHPVQLECEIPAHHENCPMQ